MKTQAEKRCAEVTMERDAEKENQINKEVARLMKQWQSEQRQNQEKGNNKRGRPLKESTMAMVTMKAVKQAAEFIPPAVIDCCTSDEEPMNQNDEEDSEMEDSEMTVEPEIMKTQVKKTQLEELLSGEEQATLKQQAKDIMFCNIVTSDFDWNSILGPGWQGDLCAIVELLEEVPRMSTDDEVFKQFSPSDLEAKEKIQMEYQAYCDHCKIIEKT